jgi:formate/nitrite transporter FocA (FNT family)
MTPENHLELSEPELKEAEERSSVTVHVVHEAVRREGEEELKRTPAALWWSGLAAGLSMGLSLITEGILRSKIPDVSWRPLIAKAGYSMGFILVILGRQQLFTENTLTPMLPLFHRRDRETLNRVAMLWAVVLAANLVGATVIAWVLGNTGLFPPETRRAFEEIGQASLGASFGLVVLRGVFAGWLIAMLVWVLPFAETGRTFVIILFTWVIGVAGFSHVVAGSVDVLFVSWTGVEPWTQAAFGYILPALIGNILGGVSLVAVLNHAQVIS